MISQGVDILYIPRIDKLYEKYGQKFLNKFFTSNEIEACTINGVININKIAKRFSAKEAFSKALGYGIGEITFRDIEILNNKNKKPYIKITEKIKNYVILKNNWHDIDVSLSISDDKDYSMACVIIYQKGKNV